MLHPQDLSTTVTDNVTREFARFLRNPIRKEHLVFLREEIKLELKVLLLTPQAEMKIVIQGKKN